MPLKPWITATLLAAVLWQIAMLHTMAHRPALHVVLDVVAAIIFTVNAVVAYHTRTTKTDGESA